jgi:DNA-3-methyladenine glycosylase
MARSAVQPVPREFFARHPRTVARALLGKVLVRPLVSGAVLSGRIVETEAYLGADDAAAHAAAGKTPRNAVLFGPPGHAYVYFTYGMHYCLNVSCEPAGRAGCVLFRALEPLSGMEQMRKNRHIIVSGQAMGRPSISSLRALTSGPARLCAAFAITRDRDNGKDLTSPSSDLLIADDGFRPGRLRSTTRIGITKSPELPLRFYLEGSAFVSTFRP